MYRYLRGTYRGLAEKGSGLVILEVGGIGYEVLVPPIVEQEIVADCDEGADLLLYVSAVSGRDQPWPALFGFLREPERDFWDLLRSVPRVGGKGAAKAMAIPIPRIAAAIVDGNKALLDGLPGVTLEGAEKMIAALRKKVGPFVEKEAPAPVQKRPTPGGPEELKQDAVDLLVVMGVKRPDAQRGVESIVGDDAGLLTVQEVITEYFRLHGATRA